MAEEKKPKIDLKSRLAKANAGANPGANAGATPAPIPGARGSVPPPVVGGGVPPPPITGGIPVPPFAQPARPQRQQMTVDPSDPYAVAKGGAPAPKPQEIKVEVGAEAVEAAKASRKYIAVAAIVAMGVGVAMGWNFGSGSERTRKDVAAIEGAALLAKDVDASNAKIKELAEKIGAASKSLKDRKFPDTFATDLGGLNIPFDSDKLVGKGVGSYPSAAQTLIFQYASDVAALKNRQDALKSLFAGQKKAIQDQLEAGEKPMIRYTAIIIKAPKGSVASIAPISEPFLLSADWPKEYKMKNLITSEVQPITHYDTGDVWSTKDKRLGIPIEPDSLTAAFPNDISTKVLSELSKTMTVIIGGGGDDDTAGLQKEGEALAAALKKLGEKKLVAARRTRVSAKVETRFVSGQERVLELRGEHDAGRRAIGAQREPAWGALDRR